MSEYIAPLSSSVSQGKRFPLLDIIKGVAIFLVTFQHCVHVGNGAEFLKSGRCFDDIFTKLICSFHMPLFILVSGFLFYRSVEKYTFRKLLATKCVKNLLPIISYSIIWLIVISCFTSNMTSLNVAETGKRIIITFTGSLWFLWSLFYCSLFVAIIRHFLKDSLLCYLGLGVALFFIKDCFLLTAYTKYLYPYFVLAYYFAKYRIVIISKFKPYVNWFFLVAFVIWGVGMIFYNRDSFIYTTGFSYVCKEKTILDQAYIDFYRLFIGFWGCLWVIGLCCWIQSNFARFSMLFERWGRNSLGIYVFQMLFVFKPVTEIITKCNLEFNISYIGEFFISIILLFFLDTFTIAVQKNRFLNYWFLGGR